MAVTITEDIGTITVTGALETKSDLETAGVVTVTENLIVSGNLHIADAITESGDLVGYFSLEVPNIPLDAVTRGYTIAPQACKIVEVCTVLTEVPTAGNTKLSIESGIIGPDEVCACGTNACPLGYTTRTTVLGFGYTLLANATIEVYTDGTGTAGVVNVTLICKQA